VHVLFVLFIIPKFVYDANFSKWSCMSEGIIYSFVFAKQGDTCAIY
jgi:hypothetical protein